MKIAHPYYNLFVQNLDLSLLLQVLMQNGFTCRTPQLASAVNFVGELLNELLEGGESPGGIPAELDFVAASTPNPDGSSENASCLVEQGALYEVGSYLRFKGLIGHLKI